MLSILGVLPQTKPAASFDGLCAQRPLKQCKWAFFWTLFKNYNSTSCAAAAQLYSFILVMFSTLKQYRSAATIRH